MSSKSASSRTQHLNLPTASTPDEDNSSKTQSVANSFVLHQSLKQSRDKWLYHTFPKFSSRARPGKHEDIIPPPHTIQYRGKCDMHMGPHAFPDTMIYEVHYLPLAMSYPTGKWIEANTNDFYNRPMSGSSPTQDSASSLLSSLPMGIPITPQLVSEVKDAASTNPPLANLLQLALTGAATPDQRQTLVLLIQSLPAASRPTNDPNSVPPSNQNNFSAHVPAPIYATRQWDLVFEFRELPSERWIFPRGHVVCKRQKEAPSPYYVGDCTITAAIPFDRTSWVPVSDPKPSAPPERMVFTLGRTPNAVWDTLERWSDTMQKDSQTYLDSLSNSKQKRVYLKYHLPEGAQLTQIKNAATAPPATKLIRPNQSERNRSRQKRSTQASESAPSTSTVPVEATTKRRRKSFQAQDQAPESVLSQSAPQRRARIKIACYSCGKMDVPLLANGRFCAPCIESGKADAVKIVTDEMSGEPIPLSAISPTQGPGEGAATPNPS